jgi:hypothetical protein
VVVYGCCREFHALLHATIRGVERGSRSERNRIRGWRRMHVHPISAYGSQPEVQDHSESLLALPAATSQNTCNSRGARTSSAEVAGLDCGPAFLMRWNR